MNNVENIESIYLFVALISLIVAILSLRYTWILNNYLKEFIFVAKNVSNKEFHVRLHSNANGELGELTKNFNHMIDTMDKTISEVEYKHIQLKSIIKSVSHGILAVDINANILLINKEAKKIIKCDASLPIEGHNINTIIKEEKVLKEILKFLGSKTSEKRELKLNDGTVYKLKVDPVYLQNTNSVRIGSIVNIEDITEKVKLENMRSDFVANVSHELKTPLTSISGFVETLRINENIDVSVRNKFLGIIESESDRLKRLIDDILLLSFIENKDNVAIENIKISDVYDVYKEVYYMISLVSKSKNITVLGDIDENVQLISNRDYIKQIFVNLIDNAVKYTPDGGEVNVFVKELDNNVVIKVKDNGVGIPKEDINRIFERFYRVDKARSRDVGGTGLGLAIIKHILKNLNGTIEVKSELNKGSEFIVTIPKKIS